MVDVARGRRATVLPEVGCVSIAHDPLLERTRHLKSDKLGRCEGKGSVKTKGRQGGGGLAQGGPVFASESSTRAYKLVYAEVCMVEGASDRAQDTCIQARSPP